MKTLEAAVEVGKVDPTQASNLLTVFFEPFQVNRVNESRVNGACSITEGLYPGTTAYLLESFEPNIPWTKQFLLFRKRAYRDVRHPLEGRAQQDLDNFLRRETPAPTTGAVR